MVYTGQTPWQRGGIRWGFLAAALALSAAERTAPPPAPPNDYLTGYNALFGRGKKDFSAALKAYTQAANAGSAEAQYSLAFIYENGLVPGVTNLAGAVKWYTMAADNSKTNSVQAQQALVMAQFQLGNIHYSGSLGRSDAVKATNYLVLAARNGMVEAQYNLARLFCFNNDVKNSTESFKWILIAVSNGCEQAASPSWLDTNGLPGLNYRDSFRKDSKAVETSKNEARDFLKDYRPVVDTRPHFPP